MRIFSIVFFVILLGVVPNVIGQETTISVGTNISIFKIRDAGMSSMAYNGFIPGVETRMIRRKENSISTFYFNGEKGVLSPKGNKDGRVGKVNQTGFNAYYSYIRKFPVAVNEWSFFGGLQVGTVFRNRLHSNLVNSAKIYESINYVSPSIYAERKVKLFQLPLEFGLGFNVPVFAAVIRPSITNLGDFLGRRSEEFKDRFEEHGFTSFDNLLMLQSEASLKYQLNNTDKISLNYSWQFIDYSKSNSFQYANHSLGVNYVKALWKNRNKVKEEESK